MNQQTYREQVSIRRGRCPHCDSKLEEQPVQEAVRKLAPIPTRGGHLVHSVRWFVCPECHEEWTLYPDQEW